MVRSLVVSLAVALAAGAAGCQQVSQFGDMVGGEYGHGIKALAKFGNAASLSADDEDALGQSFGVKITNTYQVTGDQALLTYVNYVGLAVSMGSENPTAKYVFAVLETNEVNAMSAPGGYIFITRGALNLCKDEAELAGVLAHEIAHVNHQDGLNEVKAAEFRAGVTEAAQAHSQTAGFAGFANMGVDVLVKGAHSQESELKADASAVQFLSNAGYDPASYLRYLQRLQKAAGNTGGNIMSTHPGTGQRIATVTGAIGRVKPGGATLQQRFFTAVPTARGGLQ